MNTADLVLVLGGLGALSGLVYILFGYISGLRKSPPELWLLYGAKVFEYAAYGSSNMAFVLFLSKDCGLSDIQAGTYISAYSTVLTVCSILVGALVDAIGIKRTLLGGVFFVLISRLFLPTTNDLYLVTFAGFLPMALGIGMVGPVLSVGIKRYTTREGATLGFGLFYTLMNVGWALGGLVFDWVRRGLGEHATVNWVGMSMSTYQVIFLVGGVLTIPTLILTLLMRDGVERHDDGSITVKPTSLGEGTGLASAKSAIAKAAADTKAIFSQNFVQKAFWLYLFMLAIPVAVRLVFYHFHYTFPKYGIRVLGEGVKIGSIYGVLNPVLIVFLVPLLAAATKKVSSYKMLLIGTAVSSLSVFIAVLPAELFSPLMNTWLTDLLLNRWLEVPAAQQAPIYLVLVFFIVTFTIGEAIWSPRLTQFTAEIAPPGREGSYVALSYLPFFLAKMVAGPMSGWLLATYIPEGASSYPQQHMVWLWVGGMACITPLGMLIFRKIYLQAEKRHEEPQPASVKAAAA